jgi:multicomponent Na+:H+ antiporter subunit B
MTDMVLETVARIIIPFIQLFGAYVLMHGHLTPGGGFSGGTIIGASLILYSMVFRFSPRKHRIEHDTSLLFEAGGAILYILMGLLGILFSKSFLTNRGIFPLGVPGELISGGMIVVITLGIGMKVAGTVITLFQELLEGGGEHHGHN